MKKQQGQPAKTAASKKVKKTCTARISKQKPPTETEMAKAVAAKKALPGDIAAIRALKIKDDEVDKYEPIVFSDTCYEFSVFVHKLSAHPKTVVKWLKNGWLVYSELGKMRFINKFDVEDMMLRFRKPGSGNAEG